MTDKRTVLLVDERALFRAGLRGVLTAAGFEVVGEAADAASAVTAVLELAPDVVLVDLGLSGPGGAEVCARIKRAQATTAVVMLASDEAEDALFDAIKSGAAAFLTKDVTPEVLVEVVGRVSDGEYLINDNLFARPAVASRVLSAFQTLASYGQASSRLFAPLSPREIEILEHISRGQTNKAVAYELGISEQTVKNHMSSILRKLSVNDRTQAVVFAMRKGWIQMPKD